MGLRTDVPKWFGVKPKEEKSKRAMTIEATHTYSSEYCYSRIERVFNRSFLPASQQPSTFNVKFSRS